MEQLKQIKSALTAKVQSCMGNLDCVDAEELNRAIESIYHLSKSIYYCTVVKAMEESQEEEEIFEKMRQYAPKPHQHQHYYTMMPSPMYPEYPPYWDEEMMRDIDRHYGRMYYSSNSGRGGNGNQPRDSRGRFIYGEDDRTHQDDETGYPHELRDSREGRSPQSRRSYMESKETHQDKTHQMQQLEKYIQELAMDLTEMIEDASPEEKTMLQQKLATLVNKIK